MKSFGRVRLAAATVLICAPWAPLISAQSQTAPPSQPAQPQQPQPAQRNPFESVPQLPPAPTAPPPAQQQPPQEPAPGQPQLEAPRAPALPPATGQYVEGVEFRGNRRVPQAMLQALIATKSGDLYNEEVLRRDFMQLWNTGRFDDQRLEVEQGNRGLIVRFVLTERRLIRTITYQGIKSVTVSEIWMKGCAFVSRSRTPQRGRRPSTSR